MKSSRILSLLTIMFALAIFSYMGNVKAYTSKDMQVRDLKSGDVIYFDNSQTKWDHVYIYIWDDQETGNNWYKPWNGDEMVKVDGTDNIYEFIVPSEMTENKYESVIFSNQKDNQIQTINLGFVESGYAYKITGDKDGKKIGYWYLYDKSDILSYLEDVEEYVDDKQYYKSESYGNLDELIIKANQDVNKEIKLESKKDESGNDNGHYYIEIDAEINNIQGLVESLEVNDSLLEEKIQKIEDELKVNSDKYTEESLQKLQDTLDEAKKLLKNSEDKLTVQELKSELSKIDAEKNNLKEKVIENNTNDNSTVDKSTSDITTNSNPKTYDSITLYIVVGIISLGLIGFTVKKFLFR